MKLSRYVSRLLPAVCHRSARVAFSGLCSSSTMIVMMMASTPSLNASRRLVRIAPGYQPSRGVSQVREVPSVGCRAGLLRQLGDQPVAPAEHGRGRGRVDRDRQQVALAELAAHPGEQLPFGLGLDAF